MASGTPAPSSYTLSQRSRPAVIASASQGREAIIAALASFRATVSARNRRALELCIAAKWTEDDLDTVVPDRFEDFFTSLRIMGPPPDYIQRPRDLLTYFDVIAPLYGFDGTSTEEDVDRHRYLTTIDDALRGRAPDGFKGELRVPDDLRTLIRLVYKILGPGLPEYQDTQQISFLDTLDNSEDEIRESMLKYPIPNDTGEVELVLDSASWEVAAGWATGSDGGDGHAYVLFCRNLDEEKGWSWRYRVASAEGFGDLYDDLVSFLAFYAHHDEQDLEDLQAELALTN